MIISRTPFRIGFVGGGSDLPAFYERSAGAVVSTTIDKYMYVTVSPRCDSTLRVAYTRTEIVKSVDEVEHDIIREALRKTGAGTGLEITTVANVPAGTGLGSSSSLSVGALNALYAFCGEDAPKEKLGREASELEIGALGRPIGKQDQYAAAFGGLNFIQFHRDGTVTVDPIVCDPTTQALLSERLVMFYTGTRNDNTSLLREQASGAASQENKFQSLKRMAELAEEMRLRISQDELHSFGELLDENWQLKRELAGGITNPRIDGWYEEARKAGAGGGKILGAGGRGFLLFYCEEQHRPGLIARMGELGLREFQFELETEGSAIVCDDS